MGYQGVTEETTITTWIRANSAKIYNELDTLPHMVFQQEKIIKMADGSTVHEFIDPVTMTFTDPLKSFPIVNWQTGLPERGAIMTYDYFRSVMHSLYKSMATQLPPPVAPPPAPEQEEAAPEEDDT